MASLPRHSSRMPQQQNATAPTNPPSKVRENQKLSVPANERKTTKSTPLTAIKAQRQHHSLPHGQRKELMA